MNVLVIGGAGYVGSVTVEALIKTGHYVVVLDNLSTGYRRAVHPEAAFVLADVGEGERLAFAALEHDVEAVIHFATASLDKNLQQNKFGTFFDTGNTLTLFKTLLKHGVTKFVLSSTTNLLSTFGTLGAPYKSFAKSEGSNTKSSHIQELLNLLDRPSEFGYVHLQYSNAAGASEEYGEFPRLKTNLIHQTLWNAQSGRATSAPQNRPNLTSVRNETNDYLHVVDIANACVLALASLKLRDVKTYILGNDRGFSTDEILEMCRRVTGNVPLEPKVFVPTGGPVVDSSQARRELGWQPYRSDLKTIVTSAWAWWQRQLEDTQARHKT